MRYGLLGPLIIGTGDGSPLRPVPAAKQRILIAALLLRANSVVPDYELHRLIWPGKPEGRAQVSLHTLVTRTRDTLGDGHRIRHEGSGYLIEVASDELDLHLFSRAFDTGSRSVREGDWHLAAKSFRDALGLWRGPLLADVPAPELREAHEQFLAEQRIQALELRIETDLQLGSAENLIGEIRHLTGLHPMRERLHAQYMTALYRSGRRAEALDAFHEVRRLLVTELGIEPGSDLQRLHRQMLADDPALLSGPADQVAQVPVRLVLVTPRQLPPASRHFVAREGAMSALAGLLDQAGGSVPVALIEGMAGVGKTTLAVKWAQEVADRFPDGQLFLNLRGFDPTDAPLAPGNAARMMLETLGIPAKHIPSSLHAQIALYRSITSGKRMLIVLDNVRNADQVRPLLPGGPGSVVLITSRIRLDSLVAVEGAHLVHLDVLSSDEARLLIRDRLSTQGNGATQDAVAELAALCGGLPLALSVAATRVCGNPRRILPAVIRELADMRRQPAGGLNTGDESVDLYTVFSWSLNGLDPASVRMLELAGTHPGPDISVPAAASLAGVSAAEAARAMRQLAAANLLAEHSEGRFTLHDLIRSFAAERFCCTGKAQVRAALLRVCDHYLHTSHSAALLMFPGRDAIALPPLSAGTTPESIPDRTEAMTWFRAEHQVLLRIIGLAANLGFNRHAWQLPWVMTLYFSRTGSWQDWMSTQETALTAARLLGDRGAQARAHRALGVVQLECGLTDGARHHLQAALTLSQQADDPLSEAHTRQQLAFLADALGLYSGALAQARQARELFVDCGSQQGVVTAVSCIGKYLASLGKPEQGLDYCAAALDLATRLGQPVTATCAWAWNTLGFVHERLRSDREAADDYRRAADIFLALDDQHNYALTLSAMAGTYARMGREAEAGELRRKALKYVESSSHPAAEPLRRQLIEGMNDQLGPRCKSGVSPM